MSSRWFRETFLSPSWRSLNPWKGNHPKKVTSRIARIPLLVWFLLTMFFFVISNSKNREISSIFESPCFSHVSLIQFDKRRRMHLRQQKLNVAQAFRDCSKWDDMIWLFTLFQLNPSNSTRLYVCFLCFVCIRRFTDFCSGAFLRFKLGSGFKHHFF